MPTESKIKTKLISSNIKGGKMPKKLQMRIESSNGQLKIKDLVKPEAPLVVYPVIGYALISVEADGDTYDSIVIVNQLEDPVDGHISYEMFRTASDACKENAMHIIDEMLADENDELFGLEFSSVESKTRPGASYIVCNVV